MTGDHRQTARHDGASITRAGRMAGRHSSMRGYTLIEVIVAFSLLALALSLLLGSLGNASRQIHWADGAGRGSLYAQSLLDQIGVGAPLTVGQRQGNFEDGRYQWTMDVHPYVEPGTAKAAATGDGAQLFEVQLHMEWGQAPAQRLDVQTLRLSRPVVAAQ